MSQGAHGPHLGVDVGIGIGLGFPIGFLHEFRMGRAAGVQHQHRHAGFQHQPAQGRPVHGFGVFIGVGVLEDQVTVLAAAHAARHDHMRHALVQAPVDLSQVLVGSVSVEVNHVIGLAHVFSFTQDASQLGKGGRPQDVHPKSLVLVVTLDQLAGDRTEGHIVPPAGPTDHQQNTHGVAVGSRDQGPVGGADIGAHERFGAKSQGDFIMRVAHQLPGHGGGAGHLGQYLDPGIGKLIPQVTPKHDAIVIVLENAGEELFAHLGHTSFHAAGNLGTGLVGMLRVILQIPAEIFLVRRTHFKVEFGNHLMIRQAGSLQTEFHAVAIFLKGNLLDTKFQNPPPDFGHQLLCLA